MAEGLGGKVFANQAPESSALLGFAAGCLLSQQ